MHPSARPPHDRFPDPLPRVIELRGAQPNDAPAIAEIWEQGWRDGHSATCPLTSSRFARRRFYERRGWSDDGQFDHQAPSDQGPITVPSHRYIKRVSPDSD